MSHVAKVFRNGRSQAVRLPAAFRFDTREVFIRRDPATGDLDILIAAHALPTGCALATSDRAFVRVPGLVVQDWMQR